MSRACAPEELFTLNILAPHLLSFEPPQSAHDPAGDWQLSYRVYSLAAVTGIGGRLAMLKVGRKRLGADRFTLELECLKPTHRQFVDKLTARIEARAEPLPVPEKWSWQSQIADAEGKVLPLSRLERSARLAGNVMELGPRKLPVDGPCTVNWLLFEAVGRLPRKAFPLLQFTLLDDFDRPKPGHVLHYARSATVQLGRREVRQTHVEELEKGRIHKTAWALTEGRPVPLHAYHHLGEGSVPWIYWIDDQGRLLFAVSGVEAYVLDTYIQTSGSK